MQRKLDTYRKLINEMIDKYKELGEDVPEKMSDYDGDGYLNGINIRKFTDVIKIHEYNSEEVREFDYIYRKENTKTFIIMFISGYLVSNIDEYKGWAKRNRETYQEYGSGKTDSYILISYVGDEYDIDNPPEKIESVVPKTAMKKMNAVNKKSKTVVSGYYKEVDAEIDSLCKKLK